MNLSNIFKEKVNLTIRFNIDRIVLTHSVFDITVVSYYYTCPLSTFCGRKFDPVDYL